MKNVMYTLMLTAAVATFAMPAQAAKVTNETTVIETGVARDPALLEAAKNRMTRDMQAELASRGYDVSVTGDYDLKTANAVRKFQTDNGHAATGEASADLLVALGVDTNLGPTQVVQERETLRYKLADKGSENANVYDDADADRTGSRTFKQRYQRMTATEVAPGVTTTKSSTVYTGPVVNR